MDKHGVLIHYRSFEKRTQLPKTQTPMKGETYTPSETTEQLEMRNTSCWNAKVQIALGVTQKNVEYTPQQRRRNTASLDHSTERFRNAKKITNLMQIKIVEQQPRDCKFSKVIEKIGEWPAPMQIDTPFRQSWKPVISINNINNNVFDTRECAEWRYVWERKKRRKTHYISQCLRNMSKNDTVEEPELFPDQMFLRFRWLTGESRKAQPREQVNYNELTYSRYIMSLGKTRHKCEEQEYERMIGRPHQNLKEENRHNETRNQNSNWTFT